MNSRAFTIIELLVYTVLFSFFSLVVFGFCNVAHSFLRQSSSLSSIRIKNALAIDMIRKDLISASKDLAFWEEKKYIFCKEYLDSHGNAVKTCIGWEVVMDKNKRLALRRSEGIYSFSAHKWIKRNTSYFASGITILHINPVRSSDQLRIVGVGIVYATQGKYHDEMITLRNRWFDTPTIGKAFVGHSP